MKFGRLILYSVLVIVPLTIAIVFSISKTHSSEIQLIAPVRSIAIVAPTGTIYAEIASTPKALAQGLGGRLSLPVNHGMLFVFSKSDQYGFWMKDMSFSLDFVWINSDKKVIALTRNITPDTYPHTYLPPTAVMYVLELNAGQAAMFGITTSTILSF